MIFKAVIRFEFSNPFLGPEGLCPYPYLPINHIAIAMGFPWQKTKYPWISLVFP